MHIASYDATGWWRQNVHLAQPGQATADRLTLDWEVHVSKNEFLSQDLARWLSAKNLIWNLVFKPVGLESTLKLKVQRSRCTTSIVFPRKSRLKAKQMHKKVIYLFVIAHFTLVPNTYIVIQLSTFCWLPAQGTCHTLTPTVFLTLYQLAQEESDAAFGRLARLRRGLKMFPALISNFCYVQRPLPGSIVSLAKCGCKSVAQGLEKSLPFLQETDHLLATERSSFDESNGGLASRMVNRSFSGHTQPETTLWPSPLELSWSHVSYHYIDIKRQWMGI